MKNDHPPAYKHKIWWMGNKESSLPGLMITKHVRILRVQQSLKKGAYVRT